MYFFIMFVEYNLNCTYIFRKAFPAQRKVPVCSGPMIQSCALWIICFPEWKEASPSWTTKVVSECLLIHE